MRVPTKDMFRYQPLRLSFSYLLVCLNGPTTTITRKALSFVSRELTLVGCLGCGSLRCCRNAVPVSDARVVIYQTCCVPIDRLMEKIYGLYLTPKTWETHAGPTIARFRANRDSQRLSREDPPRNFYLNSPSATTQQPNTTTVSLFFSFVCFVTLVSLYPIQTITKRSTQPTNVSTTRSSDVERERDPVSCSLLSS